MRTKKEWNLHMRQILQQYLAKGYTLTKIAESFQKAGEGYENFKLNDISTEVKRGLTEEEKENRQYVMYDIVKAYETIIGEDAVQFLQTQKMN